MVFKKCKYVIKVILYIVCNEVEDWFIFVLEIVKNENILQKFLESILREFCNYCVLLSKCGCYGGYCLLKEFLEIFFIEIMCIMDGFIVLMFCVLFNYYIFCDECKQEENCVI